MLPKASSGGDFVKFKCADNNLYLGTDGTAPGSSVYSDKNGKETLHYWYLREANGSQLVTDGLQTIIAKAENRLASTIEGDKEGQFSIATRKKLQDAIDDADITLQNASSQQEIITATQTLNTALTNYNSQRNPAFVTGEKYYIMHASNRYLSNENNNIQIKNRKFTTAQQFVFEVAGNNTYAIKNVASNTYLNASGEYNVNLANSSSNNTARFKIDYAPNEDLYVRFQGDPGSGPDSRHAPGRHHCRLCLPGTGRRTGSAPGTGTVPGSRRWFHSGDQLDS